MGAIKPLDSATVPAHLRRSRGKTGLVHGAAPVLPREYIRADARKNRIGRKGAKARARMLRILTRKYGIAP